MDATLGRLTLEGHIGTAEMLFSVGENTFSDQNQHQDHVHVDQNHHQNHHQDHVTVSFRAVVPSYVPLFDGVENDLRINVPRSTAKLDPLPALLLADVIRGIFARDPIPPETATDDVLGVAHGQLLSLSAHIGTIDLTLAMGDRSLCHVEAGAFEQAVLWCGQALLAEHSTGAICVSLPTSPPISVLKASSDDDKQLFYLRIMSHESRSKSRPREDVALLAHINSINCIALHDYLLDVIAYLTLFGDLQDLIDRSTRKAKRVLRTAGVLRGGMLTRVAMSIAVPTLTLMRGHADEERIVVNLGDISLGNELVACEKDSCILDGMKIKVLFCAFFVHFYVSLGILWCFFVYFLCNFSVFFCAFLFTFVHFLFIFVHFCSFSAPFSPF